MNAIFYVVLHLFLCNYALSFRAGLDRFGAGDKACSEDEITIYQSVSRPLPSGIPTYTVVIENGCMSGCTITKLHLNCDGFSSARLVDPFVFRRIRFNDCLVNDGKPIPASGLISFQYANTYRYPLSVASFVCNP
ncbi:unnamed protein product [Amaranthus hypochondriacus]